MTFLVGAKAGKQIVSRSREERRYCLNCIQYQVYYPKTIPVNAWGAIGYNYKSPLIFIYSTGKYRAFTQGDYLTQVLARIRPILAAFALITHKSGEEPLFMEDGNPAHGHKSITNPCYKYRKLWHIDLLDHPGISPDMNPTEKVWREMRRGLLRRVHQPTNEGQMKQAMQEEWAAVPQEFINKVILEHKNWVRVLVQKRGWYTGN